ncbi:MAG: hypothetical protein QW580_01945 [Nitrososphaerota archaeon]
MNPLFLFLAMLVFTVAVASYPPGLSIFYQSSTITLTVPEKLVERGYPREVRLDSEYVYNRYGLDYGRLASDVFRDDGIYIDGRLVPPSSARGVLGGSEVKVAPLKTGLLALFLVVLAFALASPGQGVGRAGVQVREVGGTI